MCKRVDLMAFHNKILSALRKAKSFLETSIDVGARKNLELFKDAIWHAAAELEYALFFFSIKFQNENQLQKWKVNPKFKGTDLTSMLKEARELLSEAEKSTVNGNMLEAYENAYLARHYVLKIQGNLAKEKGKASKKK